MEAVEVLDLALGQLGVEGVSAAEVDLDDLLLASFHRSTSIRLPIVWLWVEDGAPVQDVSMRVPPDRTEDAIEQNRTRVGTRSMSSAVLHRELASWRVPMP